MTKSNSGGTEHDAARSLLRHALATLAYRGGKTLRDAPPSFAEFAIGEKPRTPVQILAHMGDLLDWALACARGEESWHNSEPLPWDQEAERWFVGLGLLDVYLASDSPLHLSAERLLQAPIADSLTHIGQLAMMRRLAGAPIRGENYAEAEIVIGRTGSNQTAARREFA